MNAERKEAQSPKFSTNGNEDPYEIVERVLDQTGPGRIEDRFPHLDESDQKYLESIGAEQINNMGFRSGAYIDSKRAAHRALFPTIMFIAYADSHILFKFDPYEESYLSSGLRNALSISQRYLLDARVQRLGIQNLAQLLRAVERQVKNNPLKYWNSPRQVKV